MKKDEILYIVMPAYNEAANIRQTIEDWYSIIEQYNGNGQSRLVIVDDGSTDDTYAIMKEYREKCPQLVPLTKENGGHGAAVLYGYRYAIENGADLIFQTDSDGQTNPKEFSKFWTLATEYDAVIGNRKVRGDGKKRKFVEMVVCFLLWLYFGVKVKDANAPYRLMRAELVEKYIDKMPGNFNLPNIMFTTFFVYFEEKVTFETITFKPRNGGKNSINIRKIVKIGWNALKDFAYFRRQMKGTDKR